MFFILFFIIIIYFIFVLINFYIYFLPLSNVENQKDSVKTNAIWKSKVEFRKHLKKVLVDNKSTQLQYSKYL